MGVNNRKRRAARQRNRARQQSEAGPKSGDRAFRASVEEEVRHLEHVEIKVWAVIQRLSGHRLVDSDLVAMAETLTRTTAAYAPRLLVVVVHDLVTGLLGNVVEHGWPPTDLAELVRRQLGDRHLTTLAATLHEVGRLQGRRDHAWVEAVNAVGPEGPSTVHPDTYNLASALGLTTVLSHLPLLSGTDVPAAGADVAREHPKLAQVRALLAKAESTDSEPEAEALSAKAQELITRHALGRLVDTDHSASRASTPLVRRLWLDAPYTSAKASLVASVASANRCQCAFAEKHAFVVLVGASADLDAVELVVTSLLVQADTALRRHRGGLPGGASRTRSFRHAFLMAYAVGIGERLRAASAAAARQGGADLLPVLRSQQERVAEEFDRRVPHGPGRASNVSNREGWAAGRAAAEVALLGVEKEIDEAAG
jgi:hypothetical protein